MNYASIEKNLVDSIYMTYDDNISDTLLSIWNLTRKVDWLVLMTDYRKNSVDLFKRVGTDELDTLGRITSAAMLRVPEIFEDKFINGLCSSIRWPVMSLSNTDSFNKGLVIDPEAAFKDSPDLIILYMLSNLSLASLSFK